VDLDAESFAGAIEWWLSHPAERTAAITRLRRRAADFTWSAVADQWLELYQALGCASGNEEAAGEWRTASRI
jgi:glycosyltransferase involved in cell wall biosynthesis